MSNIDDKLNEVLNIAEEVLDKKEDKLQHFINGKKELENLFQDPNERIVQEYFDFLAWYNSKIDNTSFPEAIKKKLISS